MINTEKFMRGLSISIWRCPLLSFKLKLEDAAFPQISPACY
jgi:hypothetical protein